MTTTLQPQSNAIPTAANITRTINTFTAGQAVSYTSIQGITRTGVVVSVLHDYDFPALPRHKYEVRMNGNRHTAIYYPRELKAVAAIIETPAAPEPVDQLTRLRRIESAFQAWETAYLAGRFEEAGRLSAEHDRLFDEHMALLFPKTAPQSPQTPVSSASQHIQAPTIEAAQEWPDMPPMMGAEGDTPRLFAPYKPVEQDPQILAAKRQAQYEAAKARVEAMNGVYQAPVRKEIVMHTNEDWRAMLGNVGGGA